MSERFNARVRLMNAGDLEQILFWRNHPKIRHYMYAQHEISIEEHTGWFVQASNDPGRHLLIFEIDEAPLGFINIHQLSSGDIGKWGFYTAPHAPKGTGQSLGQTALRYAFQIARFGKLCAQVIAFNQRSINLHIKLGFKREGLLRQQHFDGREHHDIVCFGLDAEEWHH